MPGITRGKVKKSKRLSVYAGPGSAHVHPLDNSRYNEYIKRSMGKGIQAEIKQTKPFKSLEEEVSVALLRTADQLAWRGTEMFKLRGLSSTQYNALRILRGAGEKGLACSEIGERMINRDPDITRLIDRLERRGLVIRSREQKDRRVITTRITTTGLDLLRSLDRPVTEFHQQLLGPLGERRLRSLLWLLEAVRRRTE
jgi:DNA-binding MarR family transcriptional regulator